MFQKLSGYVKACCPMTEKRITRRYLKSEQISITGIRCTFTRSNGVGAWMKASAEMQYTRVKKKKENMNLFFPFFSRRYTGNCDKCLRVHIDSTIIGRTLRDQLILMVYQTAQQILEMAVKSLFIFIRNFLMDFSMSLVPHSLMSSVRTDAELRLVTITKSHFDSYGLRISIFRSRTT